MKFRNSTFYILNFQFPRGDGASALPDPRFVARARETNRVTVLIGKTYTVTCNMPISCVGKSSVDIDVWQNSPTELYICWPVTIEVNNVELRMENVELRNINNFSFSTLHFQFSMSVWPDCLGGSFSWTNSCCSISSSGGVFTYSCNDACHCTGCAAMGYYGYESYRLSADGGSCGCSSYGDYNEPPGEDDDDDPAGVGVSFSRKVLFYEDEYYDELLGSTIPAWSDETVVLSCIVNGGPRGGVLHIEHENLDKLSRVGGDVLPLQDVEVSARETFSWQVEYGFAEHSGSEDDVHATATFTENLSGEVLTNEDTMTVVMLTAAAVETWPTNMIRRVFGVGETVSIYKTPNITVTASASRGSCLIEQSYVKYLCPHSGDDDEVLITAKGCPHPMAFSIQEPTGYNVINVDSNITAQVGESGGFGMDFRCRLMPRRVSFKNVQVIELPREATDADGYFTQPSKADLLDHGMHGAGTWGGVGLHNVVNDETFMEENPPPWLDGGSFTWPIPNAWRVEGDVGETNTFCNTDQRFELDANGTARLKKFGYIGERMTNGVYRQTRTN